MTCCPTCRPNVCLPNILSPKHLSPKWFVTLMTVYPGQACLALSNHIVLFTTCISLFTHALYTSITSISTYTANCPSYRSWDMAEARKKCIRPTPFIVAFCPVHFTITSTRCCHEPAVQQCNPYSDQQIRTPKTTQHVEHNKTISTKTYKMRHLRQFCNQQSFIDTTIHCLYVYFRV